MDNEKVLRAFDLLKQGRVQDGMNLLKEQFVKDPNNWNIHYHTGMAWRLTGDIDKAIISYKKAINLCPDSETGRHMNYYGLGIAYQLKGEFDNAIENLIKAHKLDKTSVPVLNSLGLTYKKKGNIQKAIEIYEYAAQTLMGNVFQELQNSGHNPIDDFTSSENEKIAMIDSNTFNLVPEKLKQDNLYCMLQNNIGVCYVELGKIEEAKNAFRESIQFIPDDFDYPSPYLALQQLEDL